MRGPYLVGLTYARLEPERSVLWWVTVPEAIDLWEWERPSFPITILEQLAVPWPEICRGYLTDRGEGA